MLEVLDEAQRLGSDQRTPKHRVRTQSVSDHRLSFFSRLQKLTDSSASDRPVHRYDLVHMRRYYDVHTFGTDYESVWMHGETSVFGAFLLYNSLRIGLFDNTGRDNNNVQKEQRDSMA